MSLVNFNLAIQTAIQTCLQKTINDYINDFAEGVISELEEKKSITKNDIITIWNVTVAKDKDLLLKTKGKQNKNEDKPGCIHEKTKPPNAGEKCGCKVSLKSVTQLYCSKHYKAYEEKKEEKKGCRHQKKDGDFCNKGIGKNSKTGLYCCKHITHEQPKRINKTQFAKSVKEKLEENDNDMDVVLKLLEDEFGWVAIYNFEKLSTKLYKMYHDQIDEYIQNTRDDHEDEIKKLEKSKEDKKSDDEVDVEDKNSDVEEEKPKKSGKKLSKKSNSSEDEEEKKPKKSGKKKLSNKSSDEEEGKKPKKSGKKPDNNEEKSISPKPPGTSNKKVVCALYKKGELQGEHYIIDEEKQCDYLVDKDRHKIHAKVINCSGKGINRIAGEHQELDDEDIEHIKKVYGPQYVE